MDEFQGKVFDLRVGIVSKQTLKYHLEKQNKTIIILSVHC